MYREHDLGFLLFMPLEFSLVLFTNRDSALPHNAFQAFRRDASSFHPQYSARLGQTHLVAYDRLNKEIDCEGPDHRHGL